MQQRMSLDYCPMQNDKYIWYHSFTLFQEKVSHFQQQQKYPSFGHADKRMVESTWDCLEFILQDFASGYNNAQQIFPCVILCLCDTEYGYIRIQIEKHRYLQ